MAFWFLDAGYGLMGIVWANLVSRLARLATIVPLMLANTGPWHRGVAEGGHPAGVRWLMRLGWPLFLSTTFGIIYFKIDIVMLTEMASKAATGIYFLGHRPLDIMLIMPSLFATAFFPAMARYGDSAEDIVRLGERAMRYLLCLMMPLALLVVFVAGPIIHWFEGRSGADTDFADSITVLRIVMLAVPFQSANYVFNRLLISAGREKDFIIIAVVPMVGNVMLNLLLIPRYSYYGAAVASLFSLVVSCAMHLLFVRRTRFGVPLRRAVLGNLAALAVGWLAASALAQAVRPGWGAGWFNLPLDVGWGPFLAVAGLTGVMYLLAAFVCGVLRREDLQLLRQLVRGSS